MEQAPAAPVDIAAALAWARTHVALMDARVLMCHGLQWPAARLLPYQVRARARHRELVRFFREEILQNG